MATVYVTENGVQVHRRGERLLVMRQDEVLQDIPLIKVDRLVLVGRGVGLTTPALYALARRGVDVLYLNSHGGYVSRLVGREHRHSRLRQQQAIKTADPAFTLPAARRIVDGKVHNQRVLAQRHTGGAPWAAPALAQMEAERRQAAAARSHDELRGHEGAAAKAYFSLLRTLIQPSSGVDWGFHQRAYYPPPDPVNALLSFGYTLLLNDLVAACQVAGLDPDLGFFHTVDYNKPSLALDLEEEFRPLLVDSLVLAAINKRILQPGDFEAVRPQRPEAEEGEEDEARPGAPPAGRQPGQERAVYLKEASRKRFIALYEARLNESVLHPPSAETTTYRRILALQTYLAARLILGEVGEYTPFTIR